VVLWQGVSLSTRHTPDARFVPSLSSSNVDKAEHDAAESDSALWEAVVLMLPVASSQLLSHYSLDGARAVLLSFVVFTPLLFLVS